MSLYSKPSNTQVQNKPAELKQKQTTAITHYQRTIKGRNTNMGTWECSGGRSFADSLCSFNQSVKKTSHICLSRRKNRMLIKIGSYSGKNSRFYIFKTNSGVIVLWTGGRKKYINQIINKNDIKTVK